MRNKKLSAILVGLFVSISIFLFSLWRRIIHVDDGWLAEHAFFLNKLGFVKSEALRGWLQVDQQLFVYHKLFAYFGSWWGSLFGFGPYALKSISILFVVLSIPFLNSLYKKFSDRKEGLYLFYLLYFSFFHVFELSYTYRPEMALTLFTIISFWSLMKYMDQSKPIFLVLLGLASGASVATHLNGVAIVGALVLTLWFLKKFKAGFVCGLIGLWGVLFYFVDVRSINDFETLIAQFRSTRELTENHFGWLIYLLNILDEHKRFFHSPEEIAYSVLIMVALLLGYKNLKIEKTFERKNLLLIFSIILSVCVASIAHVKTAKYIIYASPFFLMWVSMVAVNIKDKKEKWVMLTTIAAYLVVSWGVSFKHSLNKEKEFFELKKVASIIPEGTNVIAGTSFFFVSQGKWRVQTYTHYQDEEFKGNISPTPEDFLKMAEFYKNEYIILSPTVRKHFHFDIKNYLRYELVNLPEESSLVVLRLKKEASL